MLLFNFVKNLNDRKVLRGPKIEVIPYTGSFANYECKPIKILVAEYGRFVTNLALLKKANPTHTFVVMYWMENQQKLNGLPATQVEVIVYSEGIADTLDDTFAADAGIFDSMTLENNLFTE